MSSRTAFPTLPPGELDFLMQMFSADSKNYHVWTYRQWLVRHFDLWDSPREIDDVDALLQRDVRNNSAWNHRYMLRFAPRDETEVANMAGTGNERGKLSVVDEDLVDAELSYTQAKILLAPENRSAWLYARGVLRAADRPLSEWKGFAGRFVAEEIDDSSEDNSNNNNEFANGKVGKKGKKIHVKSSLAVEWLADVFALETQVDQAVEMFALLKDKYDPVRNNYWEYRIGEVRGGLVRT